MRFSGEEIHFSKREKKFAGMGFRENPFLLPGILSHLKEQIIFCHLEKINVYSLHL
jgi:hypothetical protein